MSDHAERIAEAERVLAIRQQKVSRPDSQLEDDWQLERARNRLLQAQLDAEKAKNRMLLKQLRLSGSASEKAQEKPRRETPMDKAEALFPNLKRTG